MRLYVAAITAAVAVGSILLVDANPDMTPARKAAWAAAVFVLVACMLYFPGNPFA
jgi:hypothetical protein